jgi:hypothetical protein
MPAAPPVTTQEALPAGSGHSPVWQLGARTSRRALFGALAAAGFVVFAFAVEVLGGLGANSPAPAWAEWVVPIAWPQGLRVVWWLAVASAAGAYRLLLARAGFRQRPFVVVLTVAPFLVFAIGVASGAPWATWH